MTTRKLINAGYIVFNKNLRVWVITQEGLRASTEGIIDHNVVVRVCREMNDRVDVMYLHDNWA